MDASSTDDPPPVPLHLAPAPPNDPPRRRDPDDGIPLVMPVAAAAPVRPTVIAPPPDWVPAGTLPRATRVRPRRRAPDPPLVPPRTRSVAPLMLTMGFFAAMMAVSFGQLIYAIVSTDNTQVQPEAETRARMARELMVAEGIDTALVLLCLAVAGLPAARRALGEPLSAWVLAGPGLILMLAVNIGYSLALRALAKPDADDMPIDVDLASGWIAILLVCLQPAVVEELFFRYLLLGHLRPHLGMHGAVWVSAVVFGMAHLGNPIGWPVLIVLGAGLGYARTCGGGLALPMVLHFLHNLAVLVANELMFR